MPYVPGRIVYRWLLSPGLLFSLGTQLLGWLSQVVQNLRLYRLEGATSHFNFTLDSICEKCER